MSEKIFLTWKNLGCLNALETENGPGVYIWIWRGSKPNRIVYVGEGGGISKRHTEHISNVTEGKYTIYNPGSDDIYKIMVKHELEVEQYRHRVEKFIFVPGTWGNDYLTFKNNWLDTVPRFLESIQVWGTTNERFFNRDIRLALETKLMVALKEKFKIGGIQKTNSARSSWLGKFQSNAAFNSKFEFISDLDTSINLGDVELEILKEIK